MDRLPNPRVQRTRSSPSARHSPLTRHPLGVSLNTDRRGAAFRFLFVLVNVVFISSVSARPCEACSCLPRPPVLEAVEGSRAVFRGKVLRIDDQLNLPKQAWMAIRLGATTLFGATYPDFSPRSYGKRVWFEVDGVWKGDVSRTVALFNDRTSGECGYPFRVNESYLVYVYPLRDIWADTGWCTRTKRTADAAEDLAILGVPMAPEASGNR